MLMHMTYKTLHDNEVSLTCTIVISCRGAKRVTVFVESVRNTEQADAKLNDTQPSHAMDTHICTCLRWKKSKVTQHAHTDVRKCASA